MYPFVAQQRQRGYRSGQRKRERKREITTFSLQRRREPASRGPVKQQCRKSINKWSKLHQTNPNSESKVVAKNGDFITPYIKKNSASQWQNSTAKNGGKCTYKNSRNISSNSAALSPESLIRQPWLKEFLTRQRARWFISFFLFFFFFHIIRK